MPSVPSLLSEVRFGAFLQYSPRGTSDVSARSRKWCTAVKNDEPGAQRRAVEAMAKDAEALDCGLRDLFDSTVALVPAPRSAPLPRGALWPSHRICEELIRVGFGGGIHPCLERVKAVQKSAFAGPGERPTPAEHVRSMAVHAELLRGSRIVVVDDVVTKGATLLAAASMLRDAFPDSTVACFAFVRTMGMVDEVTSIRSPCVGWIRRTPNGKAWREP